MHSLNLKRINEKAPYLVTLNENDETYTFVTESGVEYSIGFMPDDLLQSDESYEFVIANLNDKKSPRDKKVKDTVVAIVEEFFNSNSATILYLLATKLLQKREMRKDIVIELSYKGFSRASDYS